MAISIPGIRIQRDNGALPDFQIAAVAKAAGFTGNQIAIATAIALAESGGKPDAHNAVPPDDSYGLWQINMLGTLGPARRHTFGITSNDQLFDPATNAKAAYIVSNHGTNFTPWSTYTNGAYKVHMKDATVGMNTTGAPKGLVSVSAASGGPLDIPGAISRATNAVTTQLTKIGSNTAMVLLIIVFIAVGILLITRTSVATVAGNVNPVVKAGIEGFKHPPTKVVRTKVYRRA